MEMFVIMLVICIVVCVVAGKCFLTSADDDSCSGCMSNGCATLSFLLAATGMLVIGLPLVVFGCSAIFSR